MEYEYYPLIPEEPNKTPSAKVMFAILHAIQILSKLGPRDIENVDVFLKRASPKTIEAIRKANINLQALAVIMEIS